MVKNVAEDFIINKKDFKKYFNSDTLASKEKCLKYYKTREISEDKISRLFPDLV